MEHRIKGVQSFSKTHLQKMREVPDELGLLVPDDEDGEDVGGAAYDDNAEEEIALPVADAVESHYRR